MSDLRTELIRKKALFMGADADPKLELTILGDPTIITVRPLTVGNVLEVSGVLLSIFGAINASAESTTGSELENAALVANRLRPYVLEGVLEPRLDDLPGPDTLTPEDLGVENWEPIVRKVMVLSGMGLMFRGLGSPQEDPARTI